MNTNILRNERLYNLAIRAIQEGTMTQVETIKEMMDDKDYINKLDKLIVNMMGMVARNAEQNLNRHIYK